MSLVGPRIPTVIPEIAQADFLDAVRDHMQTFRERVKTVDSRGAQAYAILTICRGLYTLRFEMRPSKVHAAAWAAQQFPLWAGLIESALIWRKEQVMSPNPDTSGVAETQRFVAEMTAEIVR